VLEGTQPSVRTAPGAPLAVVPARVGAERWQAHVSLPQAGYLLQREAWYPGWRARVDGIETPVLRADVLFRAIALDAGEHDVELFFDSASFWQGALLSAGALFVIILVFLWRWLPRMHVRAAG
jgi:uncharacterized membrane protein YfhO